jgi:hypothetical protein
VVVLYHLGGPGHGELGGDLLEELLELALNDVKSGVVGG